MKTIKYKLELYCLLLLLPILVACSEQKSFIITSDQDLLMQSKQEVPLEPQDANQLHESPIDAIKIWSYDAQLKLPNEHLLKKHQVQFESPANYPTSYLESLVDPKGPDLLIINLRDFGLFQDTNRLYNYQDSALYQSTLSELPYQSPLLVAPSFDGSSITGILFNYSPLVMYFRADYLSDYALMDTSFDSKVPPKKWFLDSSSFLLWIEKAAANGHSLFQWQDDPYYYLLPKNNFINPESHKLMDDDSFVKIYEIATDIQNNRYFLGSSVWDKAGSEALKNGELEALYFPTWGEYWLREQVPDQSGLWRAAPLPLGMNSYEGNLFLLRKDSPYLEPLLNYVMNVVESECNAYLTNTLYTSPFMGKQKTGQLYYDLV